MVLHSKSLLVTDNWGVQPVNIRRFGIVRVQAGFCLIKYVVSTPVFCLRRRIPRNFKTLDWDNCSYQFWQSEQRWRIDLDSFTSISHLPSHGISSKFYWRFLDAGRVAWIFLDVPSANVTTVISLVVRTYLRREGKGCKLLVLRYVWLDGIGIGTNVVLFDNELSVIRQDLSNW